MEERASIKKSVVGRHCVIGRMTKIVGCVILDHCIIEDGYGYFAIVLWPPLVINHFIERSSMVVFLEGARRLVPRQNY